MINIKRAFSLIELSIIVAVIGIITFPMVEYVSALDRLNSYKETRVKIRTISDALTIYYQSNNESLPVPANPNLSLNDPNAYKISSSPLTVNAEGGDLYYGAIPVHDLGLSSEYLLDGFGNKFSYYITQNLTNTGGNRGTIRVKNFDLNGSENDSAGYVIVSHGHDGDGAFNRNGQQNSYDSASNNELKNIYKSSMIVNSSNRLIISSGAISDISMDSRKYDVISGFEGVQEAGYTRYGSSLNIIDNGNVGIGTTSALSALTVAGTLDYTAYDQQGIHMGIHSGSYIGVELTSGNNDGGSIDFLKLNSGNSDYQGRIKYFNSLNQMSFYTNNSPKMHISQDGQVSIGDINFVNSLKSQSFLQTLNVDGWITPAPQTGIHWGNNKFGGSGDSAFIQYYTDSGDNTKLRINNYNDSDDDIEFYQAGANRMQIQSGNTYINTRLISNSNIFSANGAMSDIPHGSSYVSFSHRSSNTSSGYGLLQHSNGTTHVNAQSGRYMNFRIGNSDRAQLYNGFRMIESGWRYFSVTNAGCSSYGCDGSFSRTSGQANILVDNTFWIRRNSNNYVGLYFHNDWGRVYARNFYSASDARYKENIRKMPDILHKILKLKPVRFDVKKSSHIWIEDNIDSNYDKAGFIAQQIKPYFPDILMKDLEGYYSISDNKLSIITLKAVQEYNIQQDEDINKISDSIDDLKKRLKRLENDI